MLSKFQAYRDNMEGPNDYDCFSGVKTESNVNFSGLHQMYIKGR